MPVPTVVHFDNILQTFTEMTVLSDVFVCIAEHQRPIRKLLVCKGHREFLKRFVSLGGRVKPLRRGFQRLEMHSGLLRNHIFCLYCITETHFTNVVSESFSLFGSNRPNKQTVQNKPYWPEGGGCTTLPFDNGTASLCTIINKGRPDKHSKTGKLANHQFKMIPYTLPIHVWPLSLEKCINDFKKAKMPQDFWGLFILSGCLKPAPCLQRSKEHE